MLNDYHIKFIHHFVDWQVLILIIGGQARWLVDRNHQTKDLDVWVRLASGDIPNLERALIAWGTEHPLHTNTNWVAPLRLRSGVQIAFPEYDDVWFLTRGGKPTKITVAEHVDVLTSLNAKDFDDCMCRAHVHHIDGASVRAHFRGRS